MPDHSAKPLENRSAVRSESPRLTPRGRGMLAISTLALVHGFLQAEARFVLFGLLGLLVLGGARFWAGKNLRKLSCTRCTPDSAFAGQLFPLTLTLTNGRTRLDAFSVEFEDTVAGPTEKGLHAAWLRPGHSATREMQSRLLKRGLVHRARTRFESCFPLGLWITRMEAESRLEMTIFPRPVPPKVFDDPNLMTLLEATESESNLTDWDGDFHGLRDFQSGDRVKLIHWPTSARSRDLVVRQFDRRRPSRVTLVFHSIRPDSKPQPTDVFESALELLCGMLLQLQERGIPVDLVSSFNEWQKLPADSPEHLDAALLTLATAKRKAERIFDSLHQVLADMGEGSRVIILSDVPLKEWEAEVPELPCVSICLSIAEIYIRQPRIRPKAAAPIA